MRAGYSRAGV
jgi:hypothetical protein